MVLIGYSGGKLIHEKYQMQKSRDTVPLRYDKTSSYSNMRIVIEKNPAKFPIQIYPNQSSYVIINNVQNLLGFDSLLPDDDCLIAIKIWTAPHPLPYIFVVDWGSGAKEHSKHLVRQRAIFQVTGSS
jgi:hypothetical protein